jgi:hypothetical protein
MLIRRIAISACALCLVLPVAASARPGFQPPQAAVAQPVPFGDTTYALHKQQELSGVTGATKGNVAQATSKRSTTDVDRIGSLSADQLAAAYGTDRPKASPVAADGISSLSAEQIAAAYGTDRPKASRVAAPVSSSARDDNTSTWRAIAVGEAALLAAFALGCAVLLSGRLSPGRRAAGLSV